MPTARLIPIPGRADGDGSSTGLLPALQHAQAEIERLRAMINLLGGGHDWHRITASRIYRCRQCGFQALTPREVAMTCFEMRDVGGYGRIRRASGAGRSDTGKVQGIAGT